MRTPVLTLVVLATAACAKDDNKSSNKVHDDLVQAYGLNDFCTSVPLLGLPDPGLLEDIGQWCQGGVATSQLTGLLAAPWNGQGELSFTQHKIEELEGERTSFYVAFATKIPSLNPVQIRESRLNQAMQMEFESDFLKLSVKELSQTAGDGLNFSKMVYHYDNLIKGPQSTEFKNQRNTEINLYQVNAMREDLALSTEHLLDNDANQDFDWARTTVMILGDTRQGGSYLLTMINFRTWNRGFHKINTRALEEITRMNAARAYAHLTAPR